jgi:hypothetical protein
MKKQILFFLFLVAGMMVFNTHASAQLDSTTKLTTRRITPPFVSDGQTYFALVTAGQNAAFNATFFSGTTYRIAAASGNTDGNLIFSVYSVDPSSPETRQLLFTNSQHNNAPYWDFKVNATVEVVIEATLNPASGKESGFAVMSIGFKQ